jgi:hypothetical protein
MTLYLMKPVMWNTRDYTGPAGVRAHSGHPKDHGFGHEEWNNSPKLKAEVDGRLVRYFHTEACGNAPVGDYPGDVVVFMYASHDRRQELVGIGGRATALFTSRDRGAIVKGLGLEDWGDAVWALPSVRRAYHDSESRFRAYWKETLSWIPVWRSPDPWYFWPDQPVTLDPRAITGRSKLLTMYGSYTEIDAAQARRILMAVPEQSRSQAWANILSDMDAEGDPVGADISAIDNRPGLSKTMKKRLVDARLGQGQFRKALEARWGQACAVTGCGVREVLRASHIKPWSSSSDAERLDRNNGLLLIATLDCLFDRRLVSFDDNGRMVFSPNLAQVDREALGLPLNLREAPNAAERAYLRVHRARTIGAKV